MGARLPGQELSGRPAEKPGTKSSTTEQASDKAAVPFHIQLLETHIRFELPKDDHVRLVVCDLLGREVATLVSEFKLAGRYDITFAPMNLASGVYLYRLQAGSLNDVKKLLLLR